MIIIGKLVNNKTNTVANLTKKGSMPIQLAMPAQTPPIIPLRERLNINYFF